MRELEDKTILMKYIELEYGKNLEEILREKYIDQEKPIRMIAEELGVHYHTVNSWLDKVGIKARLPHQKLMELVEIKRKLKETGKNE